MALLVPEIKELLSEKNFALLKQIAKEYSPLEFADCWKFFSAEERLHIFKVLPARSALKIFEILDIDEQRFLLSKLSAENVTPILEGIESPDLAKIFHKMPDRAVKKMTSLIKRQEALSRIDYLMKFPQRAAGSLMHPEFIKLLPRMSAKQALVLLQAIMKPNQKPHLSSLYVTDEQGKLLGALTLEDLLIAPEDEMLSVLMSPVEGIKVKPEMDQKEVAKLFEKYRLTSVPVVDAKDYLIGILTLDDVISIVRNEATEDIAKMVGTRAVDIRERSVFRTVQFRMPWLLVTLCTGMTISFIIKHYEPILAKVIALASFSPLIAGMGGNVGSQSATVVVRSIALGQVNGNQVKTVIRELCVGMVMGVIYGFFLGLAAFLIYGTQYHIEFSFVVAIAMLTSMTIAATMGAIGPIVLNRIGVDPATATAPMITTITDIISNLTYFALATLLLSHI